ncbi:unnamed protein product [Vicia faba]|uniref:DUF4283 domain-containing protein n=1 Tax=Vicia faba TaxID=3906 RepID=A0AAV1AX81_VICFA|nr:unnamed protein product [Vicia faba]
MVRGNIQGAENGVSKEYEETEMMKNEQHVGKGMKIDEEEGWKGLKYTAKEEDMNWAKKGFVGKVHNNDEVSLLQQKIMDVGIFSLEVIPTGRDKVFLKVHEDEDMQSLINDAKEFFQHWFVKLDEWYPEAVMKDRYTWIRIYGIPVHAWNRSFFEKLCATMGKLISVDKVTEEKRRFDFARCLVRTISMETINKLVRVMVNGRIFLMKMVEEAFT